MPEVTTPERHDQEPKTIQDKEQNGTHKSLKFLKTVKCTVRENVKHLR
jgi:hypothetical protein